MIKCTALISFFFLLNCSSVTVVSFCQIRFFNADFRIKHVWSFPNLGFDNTMHGCFCFNSNNFLNLVFEGQKDQRRKY